jgi:hypothetical protein
MVYHLTVNALLRKQDFGQVKASPRVSMSRARFIPLASHKIMRQVGISSIVQWRINQLLVQSRSNYCRAAMWLLVLNPLHLINPQHSNSDRNHNGFALGGAPLMRSEQHADRKGP